MKLRTICMIACLSASFAYGQENAAAIKLAKEKLMQAEELYKTGNFESCKDSVENALIEFDTVYFPKSVKAQFYKLRAFISYAFREEQYQERIREYFIKALEIQMNFDIGAIEEVPPIVFDIFRKTKAEYLARYSRTTKRIAIGLFGAFVLEASALSNPFIVQPGLHFGYNLDEAFTVNLDFRVPPTIPIWNSLRGQTGVTWLPAYKAESICIGLATYYKFSLDELKTFTHSASIGGHGEFVFRSGLGVSMYAELLRFDFVVDPSEAEEVLKYNDIVLSNLMRVVFSNLNICFLYTF